jgi:solute carrier family 45, member 1/2/4
MSLVAFAGPLSGLVVQPLIGKWIALVAFQALAKFILPTGLFSDRSTSRFGRRTFYLIVGSTISVIGMQVLGFTRQVASLFVGMSVRTRYSERSHL